MTPEEAAKVASIIKTVDAGCGTCVDALAKQMAHSFPDHEWWTLTQTVPADDFDVYGWDDPTPEEDMA